MAKTLGSVDKESFWRDVVGRQLASGLSVRAFCRSQSLREASFYSWRRKLEERSREKPPIASHKLSNGPVASPRRLEPSFVPAVVGSFPSDLSIVLELASGSRLTLPSSIPIPRLAELVLALESRGGR